MSIVVTMDDAVLALVIASFILLVKSVPLLMWRTVSIWAQWFNIKNISEGKSVLKEVLRVPYFGAKYRNIIAVADDRKNISLSVNSLQKYIGRSNGLYGESVIASLILLAFISRGIFSSDLSFIMAFVSIVAIFFTLVVYIIITFKIAPIVDRMINESRSLEQ